MEVIRDYLGYFLAFVFGIALVFIAVEGLRETVERLTLRMRGYRTTATIVSVLEEKNPDDKIEYRFTVDFATHTGERRVTDLDYTMASRRHTGDRIGVLYRPDDPEYVIPTDFARAVLRILFFPILLLAAFTVMAITVSIMLGVDSFPILHLRVTHNDG